MAGGRACLRDNGGKPVLPSWTGCVHQGTSQAPLGRQRTEAAARPCEDTADLTDGRSEPLHPLRSRRSCCPAQATRTPGAAASGAAPPSGWGPREDGR